MVVATCIPLISFPISWFIYCRTRQQKGRQTHVRGTLKHNTRTAIIIIILDLITRSCVKQALTLFFFYFVRFSFLSVMLWYHICMYDYVHCLFFFLANILYGYMVWRLGIWFLTVEFSLRCCDSCATCKYIHRCGFKIYLS